MKYLPILIIVAAIAIFVLLRVRRGSRSALQAQAARDRELNRAVLYGDIGVDSLVPLALGADPPAQPWSTFQAVAGHLRARDRVLTIEDLRRISDDRASSTQAQLIARRALGELGQPPGTSLPDRVLAVVIEIPAGSNRDVLAIYRDGSAQYLAPSGSPRAVGQSSNGQIASILEDAGKLLGEMPTGPHRPQLAPFLPRLSIVTFDGIHSLSLDPKLIESGATDPYRLYRAARELRPAGAE